MTKQASPDILERLFASLVKSARRHQPERLASGMDVAELLRFVPYKVVRAEIGADSDDDYGHAMTRLLAGEGGFVFADELMQDDLKAELGGKNPDLQAYRSYLNAKVTLAQERVRAVLDALGPAPAATSESAPSKETGGAPPPPSAPPPAARPVPESPSTPQPRRPMAQRPRPVPSATAAVVDDAGLRSARPGCKYCGQALPAGRDVRFCPFCGQDLAVRRCGACSAELEPNWKFCVACGRAAAP